MNSSMFLCILPTIHLIFPPPERWVIHLGKIKEDAVAWWCLVKLDALRS